MDFQFDATADGRRLKFLNVIDEHSRRPRPFAWCKTGGPTALIRV